MAENLKFNVETIKIDDLTAHPKNYRIHPEDQLNHLMESIKEFGFFRNIIISKDGIILGGHGVVQAAKMLGIEKLPVIRLNINSEDPKALKVLVGDNEISHLTESDDRALSELLKELKEIDEIGLLGTGYDEQMLSALIMMSRPESEIKDQNEAAEWVGMPDYENIKPSFRVIVNCETEEDRKSFMESIGHTVINNKQGMVWSIWWPERERRVLKDLKFVQESNNAA